MQKAMSVCSISSCWVETFIFAGISKRKGEECDKHRIPPGFFKQLKYLLFFMAQPSGGTMTAVAAAAARSPLFSIAHHFYHDQKDDCQQGKANQY